MKYAVHAVRDKKECMMQSYSGARTDKQQDLWYMVEVLCDMRCICVSVFVCFRAAGVGGIQRAGTELGPGLRPVCSASAGLTGALLYPVPTGLPEPAGL